jgi:Holliday junction resolvasome RuvABC DNA-binding subunit
MFAADAHQVFELLETIYGALDKIAKKRRIFKVETVGYELAGKETCSMCLLNCQF